MREFLSLLFDSKPDDLHILVWSIPEKKSLWFKKHTDIEKAVEKLKDSDIYVGCGYSPKDYGGFKRCPANDIAGIPALWLDVDIRGEGHKKGNLPPSEEDVQKILSVIPLEPSLTVNSGNGRWYWWLLKEPWLFTNKDERDAAMIFLKRFNATFLASAQRLGFNIDVTHDLARVARLPGTFNHKLTPARKAELLTHADIRYDPSDFSDYLVDIKETKEGNDTTVGIFKLVPSADPPYDKFSVLMENEPRFKLSWERKRKDMTDTSASSYDMSLATFALGARWDYQEVVNLLIASRRKHGDDLKLRQDYYERTIKRAHQDIKVSQSYEKVENAVMGIGTVNDIQNDISTILGVNIEKVLQYNTDPPEYTLIANGKRITVGPVKNLIEFMYFRRIVADATRVIITVKKDQWREVAQGLLSMCEIVDVGDDGTNTGQVRNWVTQYLQENRIVMDRNEAYTGRIPFVEEGKLHIFLDHLRKWLGVHRRENLSSKDLSVRLQKYGLKPHVLRFTLKNEATTTSNPYRIDVTHEDIAPFI